MALLSKKEIQIKELIWKICNAAISTMSLPAERDACPIDGFRAH